MRYLSLTLYFTGLVFAGDIPASLDEYYVSKKELKQSIEAIERKLNVIEEEVKYLKERTNDIYKQKDFYNQKLEFLQMDVAELRKDIENINKQQIDDKDNHIVNSFKIAYSLYLRGKTKQAKESFISFIKENPNHYLTDDAYIYLADIYKQQREYKKTFMLLKTLEGKCMEKEISDCNRLPKTMLEIGKLYEQFNRKQQAINYYQKVVDNFYYSEEYREALNSLKKLKNMSSF